MDYHRELTDRLVNTLKGIQREFDYRSLRRYVQHLRRVKPRNGKQEFIYRGARARLRRLQYDRRSQTLELTPFVPYDEREDKFPDGILHSDFRAWDRTVGLFNNTG